MSQTKDEIRYTHRLAPCPAYDVAGTQAWLSEMAGRGLHLAPDGFALGIVSFELGEPRKVTYRLEVVAYLDALHMPTVVLRQGKRVIRASLHNYSESTAIPVESWAGVLAESIS